MVWELGFGAAQEQGPKGVIIRPMMMLYCHIPSATIGDVHLLMAQLPAIGLTQEVVEREVRVLVEKLLEMRTASLSLSNGAAKGESMPWPRPDGPSPIRPPGS